MKRQFSLLALCLCGIGIATAQTTTNTYSTTANSTNPSYTSPVTTDSTNSVSSTGTSNGSVSNTSTATYSTNTATPTSTYSTNSAAGSTDGTTAVTTTNDNSTDVKGAKDKDYKNFVFGVYVGLNTTKFKGEALDVNGASSKLTGRLGYQAGFFVRGGGRLYGQIGAEYFASSSNYFVAGSGQSAQNIKDQINIKYIQIPVYIGYKLVESDRGISAVRVQLGLEYANQIGSSSNSFGNLNNFEIKNGTFNGLGQLGFDAGPIFLDLTYHYGFSNTIAQNNGFAGSQRRILSASVGFKF